MLKPVTVLARVFFPLIMALLCWPAASSAAPEEAAAPTKKGLLRGAKKVTRAVRRGRRLKWRRAVKLKVVDRPELARLRDAYVEARLEARDLTLEGQVLSRIGALEPGADLAALLRAMYSAGEPGAFYDHRTGDLYIAGWRDLKSQRPAVTLAACHALLDQRYRVSRFYKRARGMSDALLARRALLEGDCAALTLELQLARHGLELSNLGAESDALLRRAVGGEGQLPGPAFLRERALFPYLAGLSFVRKLRSRYPWKLMEKVYRRPPDGTEQVIHYERYWERDRPDRFRARKLPSLAEIPEVRRDTLGEAQLGLLLRPGAGEEAARRAAQGWGGDLLTARRAEGDKGLPLVIHLTSWDTPIDAQEFATAQLHLFRARGLELKLESEGAWKRAGDAKLTWSQHLLGRQVLTLYAVPADLHDAVLADVMKQWRVNGRRLRK